MTVGKAISNYIAHQRCLGKQFSAASAILTAFCRSIGDIPLREVLPETVAHFVDSKGSSDETIRKKLGALANFFRFAVARQWLRSSPMPQRVRKLGSSSFTPYIYSDTELKRLFEVIPLACGSRAQTDEDTLRTFLLLSYGAGLRRSEALNLRLSDFDGAQSLLQVRTTKFFKSRIVPLSPSVSAVVGAYYAKRMKSCSTDLNSVLFCKRNGEPMTASAIALAFRRLRGSAGIRREGGSRNQPRLHDLRHSAAVHRVTAWYRCGADLNQLLPKLATYLGHRDLSGTQRYLTMTQELLTEASLRFEAFVERSNHD